MEPKNLESTIRCNECSNIPLIGIEYINKCNKISEITKIHSFCIFNHWCPKKFRIAIPDHHSLALI